MRDEMKMSTEGYTSYVLRKHDIDGEDYESSPMGSSLQEAKSRRRVDDSAMDAEDYTKYVMRRHGLSDDAMAPSSPLSSALMKRKGQFQTGPAAPALEQAEQMAPPTPDGVEDYTKYVMKRHGLTDDVPSSPLSSALMKRKAQFQANDTEEDPDGLIDPVQVIGLINLFEMFDTYDIDGDGFIDQDEYWAITSQINNDLGIEWTRAMSDLEVEEMDTNGDGVISPEEFYRHCRRHLAANRATFSEAMRQHQDVFFQPGELDLLSPQEYMREVLDAQVDAKAKQYFGGVLTADQDVPSSPMASALLAKKRATVSTASKLAQNVIFEKGVAGLVEAFRMFDDFDEDGNGFIDKEEYYRFSCKLFPHDARTREQSDAEVDAIDLNGDGLISPEEYYRHCRVCLAADTATYDEALRRHQDVLMDLSKNNSFSNADQETKELLNAVRIDSLLDTLGSGSAPGAGEPPSSSGGLKEASGYSEADLKAYFAQLFSIADRNGDGVLQPDEIAELLELCGFNFEPNLVRKMIGAADINDDGVIDYNEFVDKFMPMMLDRRQSM